jgi:hypothetical protein
MNGTITVTVLFLFTAPTNKSNGTFTYFVTMGQMYILFTRQTRSISLLQPQEIHMINTYKFHITKDGLPL